MTEKMRSYIDGLFSMVPLTDEVKEAKEELFTSMVERYNDCLQEGMDEQEAYDSVIESIGDIHELFDELGGQNWQEPSGANQAGRSAGFGLGELINSVTEFTGGLVSGLFGSSYGGELELVNTRTLPLDGVTSLDVNYISETIELMVSPDESLIVKEYMNRNDPALFAEVTLRGNSVSVRNGRRQSILGLRSRVEVYLPASWNGGLTLSTIGGSIKSDEQWALASLRAKTVSGEVRIAGAEASLIRLSSTSGSVILGRGVGTMELHSVSGSVKVENAEGGGSFKTTSGSVRVDFAKLNGHVDASTISGGVRVNLPADTSFEFEGRSISGGIYTGFDSQLAFEKRNRANGFVGQGPYYHVKLASTSGSIHVND